jgi:hypothetical protein
MDLLKATRKVQEAGVGFYQTLEALQRAEAEVNEEEAEEFEEDDEDEEDYSAPGPVGDQIEFEEE